MVETPRLGWFSKEVLKFKYWYDKLIAMLTVHALKIKIDEIVQGTMKMAPTWIRNLKEEERKELEILLASILNKAIIDPIIVFKEHSGDGDETPYIAVIRRLFKLDTDFHVHN